MLIDSKILSPLPQNREVFVIEGVFLPSFVDLPLIPLRHCITNSSILEFFPHPQNRHEHEMENPVKHAYAQDGG